MAKIPQTFIDDLLTRINIVDVVDKAVPLKKTGANHSARCPFHNEKSPSFTVSQSKQFYYCFGCGASGNAIGFLMQHDHMGFVDAIRHLAGQVGMQVPLEDNPDDSQGRRQLYTVMVQASEYYQAQLRTHTPAIDYLKARGLDGKIAKKFQLGYSPEGWDTLRSNLTDIDNDKLLACGLEVKNDKGRIYDRFRDRIMFPIRDRQGRTIGFGGRVLSDEKPKYLNSPETDIFHKGSELYGLYEAQQANRQLTQLIVVEGYMDVIALAQFGIDNVVATLGTATTKQNAERLFRYCSNIVFCFDGDKAGRAAAWRALENILPLLDDGLNVRFMFLADGDDPDNLVRNEGVTAFQQAVEHATPFSQFILTRLGQDADLATVEGRSRLTKLAEPMIKQIPGKVLQQLLLDELAKRAQMDAAGLRDIYGMKPLRISKPNIRQPIQSSGVATTPMQQAMALLVQHPNLAKTVENPHKYAQLSLAGTDLLVEVLEKLTDAPNLTTGAFLERWENGNTRDLLAKLATREILLPTENLATELLALLKKLLTLDAEAKLSVWQQKMASGELSADEKRAYQALLLGKSS
jgi:DNA primase